MAAGLGDLRAAAVALAVADPAAIPPAALTQQVVELRQLIDGLEGIWSRLVAALDESGAVEGGTSAFLRTSCRLAPAAARARVVLARRLAERPAVDEALTAGEISVDHARVITRALDELAAADGTLASDTEAPLLAAARQLDPARLRREIAHARHALAPEATAAADEAIHCRRRLDVATTFEGMVAVNGLLSPEGGELLMTALTPLAAPAGPDDIRTPGQRRADALADLCHRQLDHGRLPTVSGERPHLTVLVPLPALTRPPTTDVPALSPLPPSRTSTASPDDTLRRTDAAAPAGVPGGIGGLVAVGVPAPSGGPYLTGDASPTGGPEPADGPHLPGGAAASGRHELTGGLDAANGRDPAAHPHLPGGTAPCGHPDLPGRAEPAGGPDPARGPDRAGGPDPARGPDRAGSPDPARSPGRTDVLCRGSTAISGCGVPGAQPRWWGAAGRLNHAVTGQTVWDAVLGPEAVRRIACDASVVRVVLDPAGQPLDVGRRTRVVPSAIRTALIVRDRGCTYPGCDRGPQWTDAHHVRHWADGGPTSLDNLILLCRHHHRAVHEGQAPFPHTQPQAA